MKFEIENHAVRVIEFTENMIDECTDLFLKVFTQEPWNDQWESRQDAKKYLEAYVAFNSFLGYVAVLNNRIVGISFGSIKPWHHGSEYFIHEFCVDNEIQRKGIGTLFINQIMENVKAKGMKAVILVTNRTFPAYGFYVKNGFKEMEGSAFLGLSL
jgi:aminoglycoside 6'-N-acetyltransferase I